MINKGKYLIKNPFPTPDYMEIHVNEVITIKAEGRRTDEYRIDYDVIEPGIGGGGFIQGTIKDIKEDKGFWEVE